jgi:hypothetical protein
MTDPGATTVTFVPPAVVVAMVCFALIRQRAMAAKASRQRWHLRQWRHDRSCNLQNLKSPAGFESHPLRHSKPQKILFAQVLNHLLAVEPPDESADDKVQRNHALSLCQLRRSFRTLRVQSPRRHESQDRFASRTL